MRKRKRLWFLGLVVGGAFLLGAFIYISGPELVWEEVRAVGLWGILAIVGNLIAVFAAWLLSWFVLLRSAGVRVPWKTLAGALVSGFSVGYLTPSMHLGGEPVRAYVVADRAGVPMSLVMATVVLERLVAAMALIGIAIMGGGFVIASGNVSSGDKQAVAVGLGIITVFLTLALVSFVGDWRLLSRGLAMLSRRAPGRERMLRAADRVAEMEGEVHRALRFRLSHTLIALALQLLLVFLNFLRPQVFFYFTQRTVFSFSQLSLYFTLNVFLTTILWLTPGGLGIAEGGRIGIFKLLGIRASSAVAFSVVYRFVEFLIVGIGVLILLRWSALRLLRALAGAGMRGQAAPGGEQYDDT
ncbi:MAG: flippase-like domain-containing protein [Candidatus Bipolaricaulota bacterium]